jgi:small conductance mechanosensitive channel
MPTTDGARASRVPFLRSWIPAWDRRIRRLTGRCPVPYYGAAGTRTEEDALPTIALSSTLTDGTAAHVVAAVLIALFALAVGHRVRRTIIEVLRRRSRLDPAAALLIGRLVYLGILIIAALWILNLWGSGITPLLTVLGVVGLSISLALQDVLRNLFAGFYMLVERPFMLGDLIEVSTVQGTVESIELRLTVLTTVDGLRVTVPNATVFTAVVTNRSARPWRRWPVQVILPPGAELDALQAALGGLTPSSSEGEPPPSIAVQSASSKGTLVELGLWAPDPVTLGHMILALRRRLPQAIVKVPGAAALPEAPPAPPAKPRRITRHRPQKPAATGGKPE